MRTVVLWTPWTDRPEDDTSGRREWYQSALCARHLAGDVEKQVQLHLRRAAGVQLRLGERGPVAGVLPVVVSVSSRTVCSRRRGTHRSRTSCCSKLATPPRFRSWNMYYNPGVHQRHHQHQRHRPRAYHTARPPSTSVTRTAATDTATGRRSRTSPDRTISRPGSQNEHADHAHLLSHQRNRELHVPQRHADFDHAVCDPYLAEARAKLDLGIYAQDQWKVGNKLTLNLRVCAGTISTATHRRNSCRRPE